MKTVIITYAIKYVYTCYICDQKNPIKQKITEIKLQNLLKLL